ncbi:MULTISPECIES: alpha/beta fold hydrolase [Sphingobacterium]|uniref:Alpha/beta fold hydrolase n=1 Tax=Sphingobacterium populi TaxID=1812824 RepID=A0ABW5UHF6_9SPHI|nr:alpha/beta hydrolase [Sphingobacterium sp. CFCC 11742]
MLFTSLKLMRVAIPAFLVWLSFMFTALHAQSLYSAAYGDKSNPVVIYIHGGPRGNATLFEGTTAQHLADRGFYVIAYDRRGEGRSHDPQAKVTFQEAIQDLNTIAEQYQLETFSLIGHSFGGLVATQYTAAFPEKVTNLILVGALFSQQETYNHILDSCMILAKTSEDSAALEKIAKVSTMDTTTAEYRKQVYEIASHFKYFSMAHPTPESIALRKQYEESVYGKNNIRNDKAPLLFYKNERQVNINTHKMLATIKQKGVHLTGIYGKQDGIFSQKQRSDMQQIVGKENFFLLDNCSHYPFVDQQHNFIVAITQILKAD